VALTLLLTRNPRAMMAASGITTPKDMVAV
jgi:hypothetical protein